MTDGRGGLRLRKLREIVSVRPETGEYEVLGVASLPDGGGEKVYRIERTYWSDKNSAFILVFERGIVPPGK